MKPTACVGCGDALRWRGDDGRCYSCRVAAMSPAERALLAANAVACPTSGKSVEVQAREAAASVLHFGVERLRFRRQELADDAARRSRR